MDTGYSRRYVRQRAVDALVDEFGPIVGRKQAIDLFKTEDIPKTGQAFYGLDIDACGRLGVLRSPPEQRTASFDVYDSPFNYLDEQARLQVAFVPFNLRAHSNC